MNDTSMVFELRCVLDDLIPIARAGAKSEKDKAIILQAETLLSTYTDEDYERLDEIDQYEAENGI